MEHGSLADVLGSEQINLTKKGKCTGCGECCSNILPLSQSDIKRIKRYMKVNNIKLIKRNFVNAQFDMVCPFCDTSKEKKCIIYEARPEICREFICNRNPAESAAKFAFGENMDMKIVRETFS